MPPTENAPDPTDGSVPTAEEENKETVTQESKETTETTTPPEPVTTPVATSATDTRDYPAELAAKDLEIQKIKDQWETSKNDHHLSVDETRKAQLALAQAVTERENLAKESEAALKKASDELAKVSQATQTLNQERTDLSSQLETSEATRVKLEVLTEEFPELLRYSKLIPANRDAEAVRQACKNLQDARQADLEAQRIDSVHNVNTFRTAPVSKEARVLQNPEEIRAYLAEAATPQEYEQRRTLLLDNIAALQARENVK